MTDAAPLAVFEGGVGRRLAASGWRVVIVGASGWLGRTALEMLHGALGAEFPRRVACFGSAARELRLRGGIRVEQMPLERLRDHPPAPTLMLHLAFLTRERASEMPVSDYVAANRAISRTVLEALDALDVRALFLPSSGAVHGALAGDPTNANPYGAMKAEDEAAFGAWARRSARPAVLARVFNLSGPYMNKVRHYALSSFILDALRGLPIEVRASRAVFRSYVAVEELLSVAFHHLLSPCAAESPFDTAGGETVEIGDLAERVKAALQSPSRIVRPPLTGLAADWYVGQPEPYGSLRRAAGIDHVPLDEQIRRTAGFLAGEGRRLGLAEAADRDGA